MAGIGVEELGFLSSAEIVKAIQYNSKVLYVDSNFTGTSNGGFFSPFKNFEDLNNYIEANNILNSDLYLIYVRTGSYIITSQINRGIAFYFEKKAILYVNTAIYVFDMIDDTFRLLIFGYCLIAKTAPSFNMTALINIGNNNEDCIIDGLEAQISNAYSPTFSISQKGGKTLISNCKITQNYSEGIFNIGNSSGILIDNIVSDVGSGVFSFLANASNITFQNINIETSDFTTSEGRIRLFGSNSGLVFKNITYDIANFLFFINNIPATTLTNSAFINCNKKRTGKFFFIDNLATCTVPAVGCTSDTGGVAGTGTWTNSGQTLIQY